MKGSVARAEELLREYPLTVAYPFGGEHFLLRWHTHNEGNHLIIAKTKRLAEKAFEIVFREEDIGLDIKEYLRVEIVAPDAEMVLRYAKEQYQFREKEFWSNVGYTARRFVDDGESLPETIVACTSYCHKHEDEEDEIKEEDDSQHYSCKNCVRGFSVVGISTEGFFWNNREKPYVESRRYVSLAKPLDPQRKLFVCYKSHGVDFHEYDSERFITPPLFLYHEIETLDAKPFVDRIAELKRQAKEQRAREDALRKLKREMDKAKEKADFFAMFSK